MAHDVGAVITVAGLASWIWTTVVFLFRAFPERGVFDAPASRGWGAAAALSFAVWIAGMLIA